MVYTEGGQYLAVDLFPGNYEVTVEKNGFASERRSESHGHRGRNRHRRPHSAGWRLPSASADAQGVPKNEPLLAYDDLYPPGAGREIIERSCIRCHGPDFLPNHQWDADQWNAAIDLMHVDRSQCQSSRPHQPFERSEGISPAERKTLVDYLVKNFGPDSTRRGLAVPEAPVDEKALGKAEFIEYHVPPLANGQSRRFHDEHLSANGDVWYTDTNGLQIGKMDPRTATWTDYPLPDAKYRGHGLVQDARRRFLGIRAHGVCPHRQQDRER